MDNTFINFSKITRTELLENIKIIYKALFGSFFSIDEPLIFFSGSSRWLFDITEDQFKDILKTYIFGDIDILINEKYEPCLSFINIENRLNNKNIKFIKSNRGSKQYYTIWEIKGQIIQIDFNFVKFIKDESRPTDFSTFAHYSDYEDVKLGIKGLFHKILLSNIRFYNDDGYIIKNDTIELNNKYLRVYSFSLNRGLRYRYILLNNNTNKIEFTNIFKEVNINLPVKYYTSLNTIYQKIFNSNPTKIDIEKMYSFNGLCDLIVESSPYEYYKYYLEIVFNNFVESIKELKSKKINDESIKEDIVIEYMRVKFGL
jgi:hypothetical protein